MPESFDPLKAIDGILAGKPTHADVQTLAETALDSFGGLDALFKALRREFESAPEGSIVRERILSRVLDLQVRAGDGPDPLDAMSDEDVRAYAMELVRSGIPAEGMGAARSADSTTEA